jgi:excisionase family DNA binding protein
MNPRDKAPHLPYPASNPHGLPAEPSPGPARETAPPVTPRRTGLRDQVRLGPACRLVSLQEAAIVLGVSVATLRRLIWAGKLPIVRLTRRLQVDVRDLDRLIERGKEGRLL